MHGGGSRLSAAQVELVLSCLPDGVVLANASDLDVVARAVFAAFSQGWTVQGVREFLTECEASRGGQERVAAWVVACLSGPRVGLGERLCERVAGELL